VTWARLDDGFYDNPKVLAAWKRSPGAVGLHARALSYCAKHEIDGNLTPAALEALAGDFAYMEAVEILVELGLWHENGDGYMIHDFLDYNPSRSEITDRRKADRERKRAERTG
jgi:hypothetical protein